MIIKFKIIEIHPEQHSMVVRYYTDKITETDLATSYETNEIGNRTILKREDGSPVRCQTDVNINIWKTPAPTEDEIKKIAQDYAPYKWFKLLHDVQDPNIDTSMKTVSSLLNQEFELPEKQS